MNIRNTYIHNMYRYSMKVFLSESCETLRCDECEYDNCCCFCHRDSEK